MSADLVWLGSLLAQSTRLFVLIALWACVVLALRWLISYINEE